MTNLVSDLEIFLLAFLSQIEIMDNEMCTRSFRSKCLKLVTSSNCEPADYCWPFQLLSSPGRVSET